MSDTTADHPLQALWQENTRQAARMFFRRVFAGNPTLTEVLEALHFDAVRTHVAALRLGEVMAPGAAASHAGAAAAAPRAPSAGLPVARKAKTRQRRGPRQLKKLRQSLLDHLMAHPEGLSTPAIIDHFAAAPMPLSPVQAHSLLRQLQDERQVSSDRGRPKIWRLRSEGQRVPDPVIIRRHVVAAPEAPPALGVAAPPPASASPTPATAPGPTSGGPNAAPPAAERTQAGPLLTKEEVNAAAEALRARFFAKK